MKSVAKQSTPTKDTLTALADGLRAALREFAAARDISLAGDNWAEGLPDTAARFADNIARRAGERDRPKGLRVNSNGLVSFEVLYRTENQAVCASGGASLYRFNLRTRRQIGGSSRLNGGSLKAIGDMPIGKGEVYAAWAAVYEPVKIGGARKAMLRG